MTVLSTRLPRRGVIIRSVNSIKLYLIIKQNRSRGFTVKNSVTPNKLNDIRGLWISSWTTSQWTIYVLTYSLRFRWGIGQERVPIHLNVLHSSLIYVDKSVVLLPQYTSNRYLVVVPEYWLNVRTEKITKRQEFFCQTKDTRMKDVDIVSIVL